MSVLYGSDAVTGVSSCSRARARRAHASISARPAASATGSARPLTVSFGSGSFSGELRGRSGNLGYAAGGFAFPVCRRICFQQRARQYRRNRTRPHWMWILAPAWQQPFGSVETRSTIPPMARAPSPTPIPSTWGRGVTAGLDFSHRLAARLDAPPPAGIQIATRIAMTIRPTAPLTRLAFTPFTATSVFSARPPICASTIRSRTRQSLRLVASTSASASAARICPKASLARFQARARTAAGIVRCTGRPSLRPAA